MFWYPEQAKEKRKQVPSSFHHLYVRFVKESSLSKSELLPASRRFSMHALAHVRVCQNPLGDGSVRTLTRWTSIHDRKI